MVSEVSGHETYVTMSMVKVSAQSKECDVGDVSRTFSLVYSYE
jgi:hypothetical protein